MSDDFSVSYDSESLASINKLVGFQQNGLQSALSKAGQRGADILIATIPTVTNWKNGTGRLDSSFVKMASTPYSITIGSPLSYAHRRNSGFIGVDSLGRRYHDEPTNFVQKAIDAATPEIEDAYVEELQSAIDTL